MFNEILTDENLNFNEVEKKVFNFVTILGRMIIKNILETRDQEIAKSRDKKKFRHKGYKDDSIKTVMGEVEFSRVIYKINNDEDSDEIKDEGTEKHVFLLDQELKIETIGKVSLNFAEKMIDTACEKSYRASAKNIYKLTGQTISHEGVRNVILKVGEKIAKKEDEKAKLHDEEKLVPGTKEIPALFEEADGLWISLQGKDKKKIIEQREERAKKLGQEYKKPKSLKSEIKLHVSYEGWKKDDDRHTLIGKQYTVGFMKTKELYRFRNAKLFEKYKMSSKMMRIMNGDGANWIKKLTVRGQIYQKDSFHITQAVNRNLKDKDEKEKLHTLIKKKKYGEIHDSLENMKFECGGEEKEVKKITILQKYLKVGLPRYQDKIKVMPTPPEGIEYRNLGTMETQIFTVLSRRFSGRKMSFSKKGATMLSKVVALKLENNEKDILEVIETPIKVDNSVDDWIKKIEEQVEKSKNQKKVKQKESPRIKVLPKPFEGSWLTESIKIIRKICGMDFNL